MERVELHLGAVGVLAAVFIAQQKEPVSELIVGFVVIWIDFQLPAKSLYRSLIVL